METAHATVRLLLAIMFLVFSHGSLTEVHRRPRAWFFVVFWLLGGAFFAYQFVTSVSG